jgi:hypothetical protein
MYYVNTLVQRLPLDVERKFPLPLSFFFTMFDRLVLSALSRCLLRSLASMTCDYMS